MGREFDRTKGAGEMHHKERDPGCEAYDTACSGSRSASQGNSHRPAPPNGLLVEEAGRRCGWETPTGPPKPPHASAAGPPSWARRTYDTAPARALIDADKWLIADATCAVLAIAPWCANSPPKVVPTCIKPALLGTAAGNGVRGTAAGWATWNAIGVPGGP